MLSGIVQRKVSVEFGFTRLFIEVGFFNLEIGEIFALCALLWASIKKKSYQESANFEICC